MNEIVFEIQKHYGVLSEHGNWKKEVNLISWNGGKAKYDIRDWDEDHLHMSKGVTLTEEEMQKLLDLMK